MNLEKLDNEIDENEEINIDVAMLAVMIVLFILIFSINVQFGKRGLALTIITGSEFIISVYSYYLLIIVFRFLIIRWCSYKYYKKRYANKMSYKNYTVLCNKLKNEYLQDKMTKEEAKAESEYICQKHKEYKEKLKWIKFQTNVKEEEKETK